jgi:small GTP-binding protein
MRRRGPAPLPVFKLVLLGDSAVGKTSIVAFFTTTHTPGNENFPTIGAAYCPVTIPVGETIRVFDVWDTAGQELYRSLVPQYVRDAHGAFLVFDVTQRKSFSHLENWITFLHTSHSETSVVVFGNKTDLEDSRTVTFAEAKEFCESNGLSYIEGSAKTGINIGMLFETIAELCVNAEAGMPTAAVSETAIDAQSSGCC